MESMDKPSRVRAVLEPLTERLERLERRAVDNAEEISRLKDKARDATLTGARYGLLAALAVASPKDALKQMLGYVDRAQGTPPEDESMDEEV